MRYLGVDFGLRRIGLATSEGELASPYKVIKIKNLTDGVEKVLVEVENGDVDKVVVGLPEGETGKIVNKFIRLLRKAGLDVDSADETLSTVSAMKSMIKLGIPREKRKSTDAHAAAEILQNYLDNLK